jgi:hypothetical protein
MAGSKSRAWKLMGAISNRQLMQKIFFLAPSECGVKKSLQ